MRGAEKRIERDLELATFAAWQTARMTHYGDKKLRPLREWLRELRRPEQRRQSREQILAAMRAVKATMGARVSEKP